WPNGSRFELDLSFAHRNRVPNHPATSQQPNPKLTIRRTVVTRMAGGAWGQTVLPHRDLTVVEILPDENGVGIPEEVWKAAGLRFAGWTVERPAPGPCAVLGHGGGWPLHGALGKGSWEAVRYGDGEY